MTDDLISRSALIKTFEDAKLGEDSFVETVLAAGVYTTIENAPAIDAVPVVHGRWVKAHGMMPPEYQHRKRCSMCGGWALQDYFGRERMSHYCPNCGAKMDGDRGGNK